MDTFEKALQAINDLRQVTYNDAETALMQVRTTTTHVMLLSEYAPQKLAEVGGARLLPRPTSDVTPLEDAALDVLAGLFPCNTDGLLQDIMDLTEQPGIAIEPVWDVSDDEFYELVDDPRCFGDGTFTSLLVFVRYLTMVIDADKWQAASGFFGWWTEIPECCASTHGIDNVDLPRFEELMRDSHLEDFLLPFNMFDQATGNPFLDWDMDDAYREASPYTIEAVRDLHEEWTAAQPYVEQLRASAESFKKERWIASKIVDLWDQCIGYKDGRVPRTLMEIWGQEEEDDDDDA